MRKGIFVLLAGMLALAMFPANLAMAKASTTQTVQQVEKKDLDAFAIGDRPDVHKEQVQGELIVQFRHGKRPENTAKKHRLKLKKEARQDVALIHFDPNKQTTKEVTKQLDADTAVTYVQPNYRYTAAGFTNDPYADELWGLSNNGQRVQGQAGFAGFDIQLPAAWTFLQQRLMQETVVAVIDSGVDIHHPDLAGRIWVNEKEKNGLPNVDDDHNGYVDDINGWDFYHNDNTVYDEADGDNHGTHVAGTIAASMNNGIGIAGIAPNAKIMPLKFMGPDGGTTFDAIRAIQYAKQMGVKISNNSWGSNAGSPGDALDQAILESGMLFITAAGNDGRNIDETPYYPASYHSPNMLAVAATDNQGRLAQFSNYGTKTVAVAAPGVSILSTLPHRDPVALPELGAAAEVDNGTYQAIVNGFGFENMQNQTERRSAFERALHFLHVQPSTSILLVADDEADTGLTSYLPVYRDLLDTLGYPYTVKSVKQLSNGPSAAVLKQYDTVIWFTGDGNGPKTAYALTKQDLAAMTAYLDASGKLMLSGRDALWGNEKSSLVTDRLGIQIIGEFYASSVQGVGGTTYEAGTYQVADVPNVDFFASVKPDMTKINLVYPKRIATFKDYDYYEGTSMAAPHVTGVAALMMGAEPNGSQANVIKALTSTGKPLTAGAASIASGKLLDAATALKQFSPLKIVSLQTPLEGDRYVIGKVNAKAKITATLKNTGKVIAGTTDSKGSFKLAVGTLPKGTVITIKATADTQQTTTKTITVAAKAQQQTAAPNTFKDVKSNHWAYADISWAAEKELIKGYSDHTFKPDNKLTEAQLAVVMSRYFNKNIEHTANKGAWYTKYYTYLKTNAIFLPGHSKKSVIEKPVNRITLAKVLAASQGVKGTEHQVIDWMYKTGLTTGSGKSNNKYTDFASKDFLSRSQIAAFFKRMEKRSMIKIVR